MHWTACSQSNDISFATHRRPMATMGEGISNEAQCRPDICVITIIKQFGLVDIMLFLGKSVISFLSRVPYSNIG